MTQTTTTTINWDNRSETSSKCLSRHWEPLHADAQSRENTDATEYATEDLDLIYDCLWGRAKTNMVLKSKDEAMKVLMFLGDFVNGIGHPQYGGMWANKTTFNYVRNRMDKIIAAYPAEDSL